MKFFILCLLAAVSFAKYFEYTNCGTPEDLLEFKSLDYSPKIPVRGQMFFVSFKGHLKEVVEEGAKVNVAVKWKLIRIPVPPRDVCKELSSTPDSPYKCPLQPGETSIDRGFIFPEVVPDGKIEVTIRIKTKTQRQVACVKVNMDLSEN